MTPSDFNNVLCIIQKITNEAGLNLFLQLSPTALLKCQVFFARMVINNIESQSCRSELKSFYLSHLEKKVSVLHYLKLLKLILLAFFIYIQSLFSWFFLRFIYKITHLQTITGSKNSCSQFKYVGIVTPHGLPKLSLLDKFFPPEKTGIACIYTNKIFNLIDGKKKYSPQGITPFFLPPVFTPFKLFFRMLSYCISSGIYIHLACEKCLSNYIFNTKTSFEIQQLVLKSFIYQHWGKMMSKRIDRFFPDTLFFFEDDFIGKQLMLAEELNKLERQTVQIQHGTLLEPRYYSPLCKWMLCCSEREKKLLIQAGIEENRLFIMGAPLQIIPDVISSDHFPKKYEILILAGQGTRELQYFYTQMLIQSKLIQSCTKGLLRTHPVFTQDENNLWMNSVPRFNRIPGSTLMMDIAQADLIVTFSLDAMIPCLWRGKKIILCYNPYHESLDFVKEIPFTKLATQKDELDKAILEFSNISEQMHTQSISHHLIDRFFGTCDIFRIKSNIENFLLHLNNYKIAV